MSPRSVVPPRTTLVARIVAVVVAVLASLLVAAPAHASEPWSDVELTSITGAVRGSDPFGFFTNLPGEGPLVRVVYRTWRGDVGELYRGPGEHWLARQLTIKAGLHSGPTAYVTALAGKSAPVARIVYGDSAGHIMELSNPGTGRWTLADLTALSGGPLQSLHYGRVQAFTTALPGQPPTAHVIYAADHDLIDLSLTATTGWHASRLTAISDVADPAGQGYVTQLTGQGPVARIVYPTVGDTIRELSTDGHSGWSSADLSTITGSAPDNPFLRPYGYPTDLAGQGPVARVIYVGIGPGGLYGRGYVGELSVAGGGAWQANALTPAAGDPAPDDPGDSSVYGYTTHLAGQSQVARVVYIGLDHHVKELSTSGGPWQLADLSVLAGRLVHAWYPPMGYSSNLPGEGQAARVVYGLENGEIHEMSTAG